MVMKTANKMSKGSKADRKSPNNGKGAMPKRSRSDGMGQHSQVSGVVNSTLHGPYAGNKR